MTKSKTENTGHSLLTVGALAKRSGVAVSALRFYDSKGLIKSSRSEGGQRQYRRDVLRRVAVIKSAQRLGLSLSEIAEALSALPKDRPPSVSDWQRLSRGWRAQLNNRIDHLHKLRDQLDGCIGCGCLSLDSCPLSNPGDVAATAGPGARLFD